MTRLEVYKRLRIWQDDNSTDTMSEELFESLVKVVFDTIVYNKEAETEEMIRDLTWELLFTNNFETIKDMANKYNIKNLSYKINKYVWKLKEKKELKLIWSL